MRSTATQGEAKAIATLLARAEISSTSAGAETAAWAKDSATRCGNISATDSCHKNESFSTARSTPNCWKLFNVSRSSLASREAATGIETFDEEKRVSVLRRKAAAVEATEVEKSARGDVLWRVGTKHLYYLRSCHPITTELATQDR